TESYGVKNRDARSLVAGSRHVARPRHLAPVPMAGERLQRGVGPRALLLRLLADAVYRQTLARTCAGKGRYRASHPVGSPRAPPPRRGVAPRVGGRGKGGRLGSASGSPWGALRAGGGGGPPPRGGGPRHAVIVRAARRTCTTAPRAVRVTPAPPVESQLSND